MIAAIMAALLGWSGAAFPQVSPAEITKPNLKRAEQTYWRQLIDLNRAISETRFPFPLVLSRYPGLDPKQQIGADKRGLEFIEFNGRVVLKISANYNAAFSSKLLTQNQRASRVLDEVAVPVLQLFPKYFAPQSDFDGVGFEISYHARTDSRSYSYEGAEVLTIVMNKADAFKFAGAQADSERQEILDNSEVYLDGKNFGLMLGQRDPVMVEEAEKDAPRAPAGSSPETFSSTPAAPSAAEVRPSSAPQEAPFGLQISNSQTQPAPALPEARAILTGPPPATQAEAEALQTKLQAQLQALGQEGRAHDFFVDYAPPSFAVFRNRIYLQLTLRNPNVFDKNATSIYRRAARSFDLFLAPRLKALLEKTPSDAAIAGLDVTVLTEFSAKTPSSSEAIEYVCPLAPLRQFVDALITNQDLINQSVVLVNGVRIALNLQQVE